MNIVFYFVSIFNIIFTTAYIDYWFCHWSLKTVRLWSRCIDSCYFHFCIWKGIYEDFYTVWMLGSIKKSHNFNFIQILQLQMYICTGFRWSWSDGIVDNHCFTFLFINIIVNLYNTLIIGHIKPNFPSPINKEWY